MLCIACHIQGGQIGEALALSPGHGPAMGSRQADVGQQGIDGDPSVQAFHSLPAAGRFDDREPGFLPRGGL